MWIPVEWGQKKVIELDSSNARKGPGNDWEGEKQSEAGYELCAIQHSFQRSGLDR